MITTGTMVKEEIHMATAAAPTSLAFLLTREVPTAGSSAASILVEAPPAPTPTRTTRADEIEISGGE